jgi:C-terminal processing protease CtpA/Prc
MHFTSSHHRSDDRIHLGYFERHQFEPLKDHHFNGNVYIVQGGFTFSAAAMFVSHLKGQKNVTVVGEESGGAYYGNTSVHLPTITLPLTKVNIVLPMYRVVLNHERIKDGEGIMPDIDIEPTSEAIKRGNDLKLRAIKERIQRD